MMDAIMYNSKTFNKVSERSAEIGRCGMRFDIEGNSKQQSQENGSYASERLIYKGEVISGVAENLNKVVIDPHRTTISAKTDLPLVFKIIFIKNK